MYFISKEQGSVATNVVLAGSSLCTGRSDGENEVSLHYMSKTRKQQAQTVREQQKSKSNGSFVFRELRRPRDSFAFPARAQMSRSTPAPRREHDFRARLAQNKKKHGLEGARRPRAPHGPVDLAPRLLSTLEPLSVDMCNDYDLNQTLQNPKLRLEVHGTY